MRALPIAVVVLAACGVAAFAFPARDATFAGLARDAPLAPGAAAPAFHLPSLDGRESFDAERLFGAQRFTLLVLWDSECPRCVDAMAQCQQAAAAASALGVRIVGINADRTGPGWKRLLLEQAQIRFLQLHDADRAVVRAYGADPYSFSLVLVDSAGVVRRVAYDRPPDVEGALAEMLEAARPVSGAPAGRGPNRPGAAGPPAAAVADRGAAAAAESLAAPLFGTTESAARIRIAAETRVRVLDLQVDAPGSESSLPTGPYGEVLEPGRSVTYRFQCEISGRISSALRAGGLLRLSNEDADILKFGPQYFSRREGSAFAEYGQRSRSLRLGYFETSFTPLTLMRWDAEDNPRAGGRAGACACAGTAGLLLLNSLEELGPVLTFEGVHGTARIGDGIDVAGFYAIPRSAQRVTPEDFIADPRTLADFAYRQDLQGARLSFDLERWAAPIRPSMALHWVESRDDEESATFPGPGTDPRGYARRNEIYGGTLSLELSRRLSASAEIDATEFDTDVRATSDHIGYGRGLLGSLAADILPGVKTSLAYLYLSEDFHSAYTALSYRSNRKGPRARCSATTRWFDGELFAKYLEPVVTEEPVPAAAGLHTRPVNELTAGLWLSRRLPRMFEAGAGWIYERHVQAAYVWNAAPPHLRDRTDREQRKNTFTFEAVRALSLRSSAQFLYQYVDAADGIDAANDYTSHRAGLQLAVRF